jgi:hypothetical protein
MEIGVSMERKMDALIDRINRSRFIVLVITVLLILASCNGDFLKKSAQEAMGGNGAGLSTYQTTPVP